MRLDPGQTIESVSLVDLVVLVEDPADIASMLLRLTDDEIPGVDTRQTALERKFSDVTLLPPPLDPRLAQVMFGRLARAVLKLDPDRRNNLLQRTVLPSTVQVAPGMAVEITFCADGICTLKRTLLAAMLPSELTSNVTSNGALMSA